ncbi:MAG: site-specific DNA-methyltransferase [Acidimicrobiaceae bacterium]|nr:site-specific DNA-methyltransferase [Acidimicrobiaceae bacterium]
MPTLDFKGKRHIYAHHLTVPYRPLVPEPDKSVGDCPDDDNLIIHGDNLHALKALLPRYAGRVKCIYIDPPYNTGKEGWVYNDNANGPILKQWLADAASVDGDDLERHDKWLCMMWPRLHLLKELLSEDGVIFISIDDNEQHHLRMLMDEIFGGSNLVGTIVWKNVTDNNPTNISLQHEYIVCYAASKENLESVWQSATLPIKQRIVDIGREYVEKYEDDESRQAAFTRWFREHKSELGPISDYKFIDAQGVYAGSRSVHNPGREGHRYDVLHPRTGKPCRQPLMGYRFPPETMDRLLDDDRVIFGADESKLIEIKSYIDDYKAKLPSVVELDTRVGSNQLKSIFSTSRHVFPYPKPAALIRDLISFASNADSIVLDSFAGSGSTAQAVLSLNKQDGGNRKFILVECEDYADSITAERVRRVISGIPDAKDDDVSEGLGGSFTYCSLGDPVTASGMLDGGTLPTFSSLAAWLMHTATGRSVGPSELRPLDEHGLIYSDSRRNYYVRYKPDLDWLSSNEAVLTEARAEEIANICKEQQKDAVVFAAGKYIELDELSELNIMFGQLPFEIQRSEQV